MSLELRKYWLIQSITDLKDETIISKLEQLLGDFNQHDFALINLAKPIKEHLDIEELMQEQQYVHPTKSELNAIIEEANIEESIEKLLQMI